MAAPETSSRPPERPSDLNDRIAAGEFDRGGGENGHSITPGRADVTTGGANISGWSSTGGAGDVYNVRGESDRGGAPLQPLAPTVPDRLKGAAVGYVMGGPLGAAIGAFAPAGLQNSPAMDRVRGGLSTLGSGISAGIGQVFGYDDVGDMLDGGGRGRSGSRVSSAYNDRPSGGQDEFRDRGGEAQSAFTRVASAAPAGPPPVPEAVRQWRAQRGAYPNMSSWVNAFPYGAASLNDVLTGDEVSQWNAERSEVPHYEEGGYVGPGGQPIRPSTTSLDIPPAIARLMAMPSTAAARSYAEGGAIGPGGMAISRPTNAASPLAMDMGQMGGFPTAGLSLPGQNNQPMDFGMIERQAQQFMQQNPQQVQQVRQVFAQALQSGELTQEALTMFVQVATVALQNPEMWPQLRQVLISQGFLDDDEVAVEFDQGFLILIYMVGKMMGAAPAQQPTAGASVGAGPVPQSEGQPPVMSMKKGGALPTESENPDGSIPINAHEGEYVVPADVVRVLGTKHFDTLIDKTRNPQSKQEGGK